MPKFLYARPAVDAAEEKKIRKLAGARHAPADWIRRARMIVLSWQGLHTTAIAAELGCHPQTVRERLTRFNAEGLDGLGDQPIPGRPRRLTEDERSQIIALARSDPPGRLVRDAAGDLAPAVSWPPEQRPGQRPGVWTLNTLTQVAREAGIDIKRSQVRRILRAEGVRWRRTRSWATSTDPEFAPKGRPSSSSTPARRGTPR
jgi:transposase